MANRRRLAMLIGAGGLVLGACAGVPTASTSSDSGAIVTPAPCGPAWTQVPSPNAGDGDNALAAVDGTSANDLWAVGYSKEPGAIEAHTLIEHWDGQAWTVVTSPNVPGQSNYLQAVTAVTPDDAWAVGYTKLQESPGGPAGTLTEHWDGQGWTIVPSPNQGTDDDNFLHAAKAFAADDVWAIGEGYVLGKNIAITLHWDGEKWMIVPGPDTGFGDWLFAVDGTSSTDMWAVGYYFEPNGVTFKPLFGHWDGAAWLAYEFQGSVEQDLAGAVVTIAPNDVWAVGRSGDPFGNSSGLFSQHWDGAEWTNDLADPLGIGDFNVLSGAAALSPSDVWASGYAIDNGTGLSQPMVEHWDGVAFRWAVADLPDVGPNAQLGTIMTVPGATQLVTVGSYTDAQSGALRTLVLQDCPIQARDTGFIPSQAQVDRPGATVAFSMPSGGSHRIAETSGLGLFDSGLRDPPASFTTEVFAAGTYPVADKVTGAVMSLGVSPTVSPRTGGEATAFHLTWATHRTGTDRVFEVQVRRPGSNTFVELYTGRARRMSFLPDAGTGTYSFRARLIDQGSGASAHFSPLLSVAVS